MLIYEDKNVLVINKPAGLIVHHAQSGISKSEFLISKSPLSARSRQNAGQIPKSKFQIPKQETLTDWLIENYPEIKNIGDEPELRPGIVHRLDKDTSGVMIVAKNQKTFEYLKTQFQERLVKKTYLALIVGALKEKTGTIDLPIGRSRKNPTLRLASEKARGKLREAITEYKVLESFDIGSTSDVGKYTLVEAYPRTGRTHQIRTHFKAIGHPVACDKIYSKNPICPAGLNRQFLHAYSLELTLPDGSRSRFEADLPKDLEKVLQQLRKSEKYDSNR